MTHIHIDGSVKKSRALLVIDGVDHWVQCSVFHVVAMLGTEGSWWKHKDAIHGDHTARYIYRTRKALPMITISNSRDNRVSVPDGFYRVSDCNITANRDNLAKYPDQRIVEAWK